MSAVIARHHAEWLSLIDISGPFLSAGVLTRRAAAGSERTVIRSSQLNCVPLTKNGPTSKQAQGRTPLSTGSG